MIQQVSYMAATACRHIVTITYMPLTLIGVSGCSTWHFMVGGNIKHCEVIETVVCEYCSYSMEKGKGGEIDIKVS